MRRVFLLTAAAVLASAVSVRAEGGCHGTALRFVDTPSEAAHQAKQEEKLVFILHVSGHFEDPGKT